MQILQAYKIEIEKWKKFEEDTYGVDHPHRIDGKKTEDITHLPNHSYLQILAKDIGQIYELFGTYNILSICILLPSIADIRDGRIEAEDLRIKKGL